MKHSCSTRSHLKLSWMESGEAGWKYNDMSALQMDYVSISARTQKQKGGGRECMCWMQMVLNCCLCFPSGMKHSLSLSFRQCAAGLMFWVNELSVCPSPSAPPPSCFHFLLWVEMLLHWLWSPSCSGVSHFAALHTQMPLGVQLPILTCDRGRPCIWSPLLSLLFLFLYAFFQHY